MGHRDAQRLAEPDADGNRDAASLAWIRSLYDAEVRYVDAQIGALVDGLQRLELAARTTIVVTSDHGEEFWEHDGFEHGHSLYEELTRVPLIVRWADSDRAASSTDLVSLVDVMPTVFEILGVPAPETFIGRSLSAATGATDPERVVLSEGTLYGPDRVAIRSAAYSYVFTPGQASDELYDLVGDPGERVNLANQDPDALLRMRASRDGLVQELNALVQRYPAGEPLNLSPRRKAEMEAQLRALGYLGRDDQDE